jgi:hypothetical protein
MQTATHHSSEARKGVATAQFPPLESVTRPNLTTEEAAYYLNRRPQTLRCWAAYGKGPIQPRRTNGLLDWPTKAVKSIAGVA